MVYLVSMVGLVSQRYGQQRHQQGEAPPQHHGYRLRGHTGESTLDYTYLLLLLYLLFARYEGSRKTKHEIFSEYIFMICHLLS